MKKIPTLMAISIYVPIGILIGICDGDILLQGLLILFAFILMIVGEN